MIIAEKAKRAFYQKMIDLQKFLLQCYLNPIHKGLSMIQKYFFYNEQPAEFLKAQIVMSRCSLSREEIIELYDYGMIDYIIFSRPEDSYYFGEILQIVIGNINISEIV